MKKSRRRLPLRAWTLAMLIGAAVPIAGSAHQPSPGYQSWSSNEIDNITVKYRWGPSVPPWLKPEMDAAFTADWAAPSHNNSDTIRFAYLAGGAGTVHFAPTSFCSNVRPGWLGCATGWGSTSFVLSIRSNPNYPWCQLNNSGTCWDVRRIAIHEVAHVGGSLDDNPSAVETNSIMGDPPTGNETNFIKRCDEAKLQLIYGVGDPAAHYPDCYDHITGHGDIGLGSLTTTSTSSSFACFAAGIVISGRLSIESNANFLALSNQALAARTIFFDRRLLGVTTWTTDVNSTTSTANASGTNWSKSFAVNGTGTVTYQYRAHYKRESGQGVDEAFGPVVTLSWTDDPDVC